jgi:hypothetical protein
VGDAPGDVGPSGLTLVEQLAGDVLEGDHMAVGSGRDLDREGQQLARLAVLDDPAARAAAQKGSNLGRDLAELEPYRRRPGAIEQQVLRRAIHQHDLPLQVDRDDARGDRLQHRLDERAALGELAISADQRIGLALDLHGHAVERAVEQADLVGPGTPADAKRVVPGAHLARHGDELGERLDLAVGEAEREPDREADKEEREAEQREVELQLLDPRLRPKSSLAFSRSRARCTGRTTARWNCACCRDRGGWRDRAGSRASIRFSVAVTTTSSPARKRFSTSGEARSRVMFLVGVDDCDNVELAVWRLLKDRAFIQFTAQGLATRIPPGSPGSGESRFAGKT